MIEKMKKNRKILNIIAGVLFSHSALSALRGVISIIPYVINNFRNILPIVQTIVQNLITIVLFTMLAINAFKQQKRNQILTVLAIFYEIADYIILPLLRLYGRVITVHSIISLIIFALLIITTEIINSDAPLDTKKKVKKTPCGSIQYDKADFYAEQLKSGTITQEEYDEIMKK